MRQLPISAYVINCATDQYKYLPSCLSSLSFCEQKIFISDKATEQAKKLARDWGWEIFEWTGSNSMCERRNYAVAHPGSEWESIPEMKDNHPVLRNKYVMFLDSDEILSPDGFHEVRAVMESGDATTYSRMAFILRNLSDEGHLLSSCPLERMWKVGVHWERDVQNDVVAVDKKITLIPVEFYHFGYGDGLKHELKQWKRIGFNEGEVSKHPDDMHTRMYLINALAIAGKHTPLSIDRILANCIIVFELFENSPKDWKDIHALEKTCRFLWHSCVDHQKYHIHAQWEEKYYQYTKVNPDASCRLHVSYANIGDYRKAIDYGIKFMATLKKHRSQINPYAMEVTTAEDEGNVKNGMIRMLEDIIKQTQDPKEKKWAEKTLKYWSKK